MPGKISSIAILTSLRIKNPLPLLSPVPATWSRPRPPRAPLAACVTYPGGTWLSPEKKHHLWGGKRHISCLGCRQGCHCCRKDLDWHNPRVVRVRGQTTDKVIYDQIDHVKNQHRVVKTFHDKVRPRLVIRDNINIPKRSYAPVLTLAKMGSQSEFPPR